MTEIHPIFMERCIQLAKLGLGKTYTNPLVGAVVVHNNIIIGEGWHQAFGLPHAEVNAISAVQDKSLLKEATLYVNLEPCSHFGKTPPCADLIIKSEIPKVVIGCSDTFSEVNGAGIRKLEEANIEVKSGVLESECRMLNKRFFTFHEKGRPYIILKWAQTSDGFMDKERSANEMPLKISSEISTRKVHQWRSEEQAILIGKNTLLKDNPILDARFGFSPSPKIVLLGFADGDWRIFENPVEKIVFSSNKTKHPGTTFLPPPFDLNSALKNLYDRQICSILVEGGRRVLHSFLTAGLWDEIRIFESPIYIGKGIDAPRLNIRPNELKMVGSDKLCIYYA